MYFYDGVSRYDDTLLPFKLPSSIWHQIGLSINFGSSAVLFVDGVSLRYRTRSDQSTTRIHY